ncbi:MAG: long-chain-fatty-acid--CoA ligase [Hyphomicrobiales bacterium]|nr:long-chain-fatty-acid--CoA ligase [Hyphomicrobiales bacterium]MDE2018529.1 long-chain-fatty-acid--CoA ligase [Hyphomicrobiales bacterium]
MRGLMQDWPLLIHKAIDYAALQFGSREVVTRSVEGPIVRTTYGAIRGRALKGAQRLVRDGVKPGDRVATLAWNTWRHLEAWYAITGAGGVYHTVNPRLFPDQIVWIVNHAEDRVLMADLTFVPLLEKIADRLPTVERYVILTDAAHMPATGLRGAVDYESWIASADGDFRWVEVDERDAAGLCYTSGTTGDPKGVLYSHRSNLLHSLGCNTPDGLAIAARDAVLPVVPLFHANSWSLAFTCPMVGAKLVLPGSKLDGASLHELFETEEVTFTAGVPTVWIGLLAHMRSRGARFSTLKRLFVGGSAFPASLIAAFETEFGLSVSHAWGMTEMSPIGTFGAMKPAFASLSGEALWARKALQGYAPFGVDIKIVGDDGKPMPWDGAAFGRLLVAGFAVTKGYFKGAGGDVLDADGFFDTGDVATIDPDGYVRITDRSKDVIKSGGEWISSIDVENAAVGCPGVVEAAVIGVAHPKWTERPLLIVVPDKAKPPTREAVLDHLRPRIAKWWLPDDVQFVDEIPHTATGKISKLTLRERFKDYRLPG